jgi:hypothetical protein
MPRGRSDDQDTLLNFIDQYKLPPKIDEAPKEIMVEAPQEVEDPLNKNLVHCWVMVRVGAREVSESFFLEPTTGLSSTHSSILYIALIIRFRS